MSKKIKWCLNRPSWYEGENNCFEPCSIQSSYQILLSLGSAKRYFRAGYSGLELLLSFEPIRKEVWQEAHPGDGSTLKVRQLRNIIALSLLSGETTQTNDIGWSVQKFGIFFTFAGSSTEFCVQSDYTTEIQVQLHSVWCTDKNYSTPLTCCMSNPAAES